MIAINNDINCILINICNLLKSEAGEYQNKGSKICISSEYYILEIFQQERYDLRFSCVFDFDGYKIFFEHVYEAIEKRKFVFDYNLDYENFNSKYLILIFNFIKSKLIFINNFPPEWFLDAVDISSNYYAEIFPGVAAKHREDGLKLWSVWKN